MSLPMRADQRESNASPVLRHVLEDLADEIVTRRKNELGKRITAYQRRNSILSDIADCDRYMTYAVLNWDERPLHDEDLQARFDVGNLWEREIIRELEGLGFKFVLSQMPVQIKNREGAVIATGKIDGFIEWKGRRVPVEIKSMNVNVFGGIKSIDDFNRRPWLRKYPRQLTLYCYGHSEEAGLFIITDGLGHWKLLPLYLDYAQAEHLLIRLERIHAHIQAKTYPNRIPFDTQICGSCPFAHLCLPDILNRPADFVDNPELENKVKRHEELKPLAAEYDDLHEEIRDTFGNVEKVVIGGKWLIQNVPSERTTYDLTPEAKASIEEIKRAHAKKVPVKRMMIQALNGQGPKTNGFHAAE